MADQGIFEGALTDSRSPVAEDVLIIFISIQSNEKFNVFL